MYLIFDTETTGLINYQASPSHSSQPHIVQLGAILEDDNGEIKAQIDLLIKPDGWTVPPEAAAVHHISTEDCEKYGVPISSALSVFFNMKKQASIVIGHNVDYDYRMINSEVARLGKPFFLDDIPKICTMKSSTDLVRIPKARGGFKWPKLSETYKFFFNEELQNAHNATVDLLATSRIFRHLKAINASLQKI